MQRLKRRWRVYMLGIPRQVQVERAKTSWHDPNAVKALATIDVVGVRDGNVGGGGQSVIVVTHELPIWVGKVGGHFNTIRGISQSIPSEREDLLGAAGAAEEALSKGEACGRR